MRARVSMAMLLLVMFFPSLGHAQAALTLDEALRKGIRNSPVRRAAAAEHREAVAAVGQVRAGLLPNVTFSEQALRSNDPVFAFGTKLRQRRFTAADFALGELNTPAAVSNLSTRISGRWNLFDSLETWHSLNAARHSTVAAERGLGRAEQELGLRIVEAYYSVLLAQRRQGLAETALATAQAILERSEARVESGVAVESDRLSALVHVNARKVELERAQHDVTLARFTLATLLGDPAAEQAVLSEPPPLNADSTPELASLTVEALTNRPDLQAAAAAQQAQQGRESAARSAYGPRVHAFGSWESNSRQFFGSNGDNWTAGVELQLDLFAGGAKRARVQVERARSERAEALRQVAEDRIRIEVRSAYYDLATARSQAELMRQSMEQAQESLRILRNRYDSGLTTIADLLRGEEAARQAHTDHWSAVYRMHSAMAQLRLATGTLKPESLEY